MLQVVGRRDSFRGSRLHPTLHESQKDPEPFGERLFVVLTDCTRSIGLEHAHDTPRSAQYHAHEIRSGGGSKFQAFHRLLPIDNPGTGRSFLPGNFGTGRCAAARTVQRSYGFAAWHPGCSLGLGGRREPVRVEFRGQSIETKTVEGRWMVHLNALKAGGPDVLKVTGKNVVQLEDVLV